MLRPRPDWLQPGEPRASIYTPEWQNGLYLIGALPEPEQGYFRAFFAHLDAGWQAVRPLQLAAEALMFGHSPDDDVANWVDVEITDNFRWLALGCLQMIPILRVRPELRDRSPFGPEPPVDELEPEAQMLGRNVRLLAMMEGAAGFPAALRGIVGPAASAFTEVMAFAVNMRILGYEIRGGPNAGDLQRVAKVGQLDEERYRELLFNDGRPGETAKLFNLIADALAVLSFAEDGVTFWGTHFKGYRMNVPRGGA